MNLPGFVISIFTNDLNFNQLQQLFLIIEQSL
jgi:hypothetical protein